tara:strand:- start:13852 stop:14316 length:465 start_codon:yes stop_codon:yes gene_type:complete
MPRKKIVKRLNYLYLGLLLVFLMSCERDHVETTTGSLQRWYSLEQVEEGKVLFLRHCTVCHGEEAQGLTQEWMKRDASGNFPAPPLNGTAHAWHHPLPILDQVIAEGGIPLGGTMPGFSAQLDERDRQLTVAYFQSFWSDEIYESWQTINNRQK